MSRTILFALALLIIPSLVVAQVIYPNRGGTGSSAAPDQDDLLIGNGTSFDLKTLVAGSNITISTSSSQISIAASLEGGGLTTADIDTEAELEAIVGDVSNIFTNNDGALADDDVSDDELNDLANTSLADPNADEIVFWDDSAGQFRFIDTFSRLILATTSLSVDVSGDWTGTLDGIEGAAFALDTDVDDLSGVTDATTARSNLGLVIGTNVQAYDAGLADIAALTVTDGNIIVGDGANWVAESGATARTSLGLGNVENTALSTWAGSSNLTTLGTIGTGVWQGTAITHEYGGLEANVSAYNGLLAISGGATSEVDSKSELEAQIADVSDFAEADGDTYSGTHDMTGAVLKQQQYRSFTWPGFATTTTATNTIPIGSAGVAETWNWMDCKVTSGTGGVVPTDDSGNDMTFAALSTSYASTTLASNNTYASGEGRDIKVGPLTNAQVTCTFNYQDS